MHMKEAGIKKYKRLLSELNPPACMNLHVCCSDCPTLGPVSAA